MSRCKIGVFSVGLFRYWAQFEGLRDRLEEHRETFEEGNSVLFHKTTSTTRTALVITILPTLQPHISVDNHNSNGATCLKYEHLLYYIVHDYGSTKISWLCTVKKV